MFWWKRSFDIVTALIALILLSPIFVVVVLLIYLKLGRPVFFCHVRPGLHGKPFKLIKFRTMSDERDASGDLLDDEKRITRFGTLLRRTSLDELPELFNVLAGSMSIVGPRPLLMQYLPLYSKLQARRHEGRPGLTGLAQVNGRNSINWEEKFSYDVYYVDHCSVKLDLTILLQTVATVISGSGVNEASIQLGAEPFTGNTGSTRDEIETESNRQ